MLVIPFQLVQEKYEREGWKFHHEQQLDFKDPPDDSSAVVSLQFNEDGSPDDKWEVISLGPSKVRSLPSPVH